MMTNSKQIFDATTSCKRTSERRLSIGDRANRDVYKKFKSTIIGLVPGDDNLADALSKIEGNNSTRQVMDGQDQTRVVEWVIHKTENFKEWPHFEKS